MARPIAETPILRGADARRFRERMENHVPPSKEELEEMRAAYEWVKARSTFYMP